MELWKYMSLLPPPVQTTEIKGNMDVMGLRDTCDKIITVLSKQSPLHRESALLSRFLYKYDKKFRNDIGYRNIRKINSALHKYLQINLLKDVENFTSVLPNDDDDYMPTRQMLEYVLIRIITFSKLMVRICVCSKHAAVLYLDRIKRGESHWMSLMPYALLSRIWSMCTVLLQHTTCWYSHLHSYLNWLQPKGLNFLPGDYKLPEDLDDWLDVKNIDCFGKLHWSQKKSMTVDLAISDEEETYDNIIEYASQINEDNEESNLDFASFGQDQKKYQQLQFSDVKKVDQGQAVSRESFNMLPVAMSQENMNDKEIKVGIMEDLKISSQSHFKILTNFQKRNKEHKGSHYFGKVTNLQSLKEFLNKEETLRNDTSKQSLTNHLSFMQWHTLKTSLLKVCDSISNNKKIERKLQRVWKEKCLDYI